MKAGSILARSFMLLGAGASADAGVPMSADFVARIRLHLESLPSASADTARKAFKDVCDWVESQPGRRLGLEPIFEAIEESLEDRFATPGAAGLTPSRALERINYEIKRVIQRECFVSDPYRIKYLDPLLPELRKAAPYPIVTLNYDNVVEFACNRNRIHFGEAVLGEQTGTCDIELVKLHGSITWESVPPGSRLKRSKIPSRSVLRRGEFRSPILETPLIYPSRRKMPMNGPFQENALRLQRLLADPKRTCCIVVGYSFPDAHVRAWLEAALRSRPDLEVILVSPHPEREDEVLDNLTRNLISIPWTSRLKLVQASFKAAIDGGFEHLLGLAEYFGPRSTYRSPVPDHGRVVCYKGSVGGIAASNDGDVLFMSVPSRRRVLKLDLDSLAQTWFSTRLNDPRGIAVDETGGIFVVENCLLDLGFWRSRGAGTVIEFSSEGYFRRKIIGIKFTDIWRIARRVLDRASTADFWSGVRSVLRWPTDIVVRKDEVFVTEARSLTAILGATRAVERICEPVLAFNLHGLDSALDGTLIGLEEGVANNLAWGRLEIFERASTVRALRAEVMEGLPRLMGLCFIPDRSQVVVTQNLTWPHGRLIVLDYPKLDCARFVNGFDLPLRIAYVPNRKVLAVGTSAGVELVPASILDGAKPLESPIP